MNNGIISSIAIDDSIGKIPCDWNVSRVKYAFDRKNEKSSEKNPTVLSLARAGVKVRDISSNEGQLASSYEGYNPVEPGDLLINPMDLYSGANCSISNVSGVISPAYFNLRAFEGINSTFYDYFFKTQYWAMALFARGRGVSFDNRWTLNYESLRNIPIPVPSSEDEQNVCASFLDKKVKQVDILIDEIQQEIEEHKEYKKAVIYETIINGIKKRENRKKAPFDWLDDIPEDYTVKKVKAAATRINVGVVIRPSEYFDESGTVPFLRGLNIRENYISENNMIYTNETFNSQLQKSIIHTGDVLVVRDGNIGVSCVVPEKYDGANVVSLIIITPDDKTSSRYLCYCLNSKIGKRQFEMTKIGSALSHTSVSAVSSLTLVFPEKEEQELIADFLDGKCEKIDNLICEKEALIKDLENYKKSLIFEVVTGKRRVV